MLPTSLRATGILLSFLMITGCQSILPSFYNVPVRQGNYLDSESISRLHPGMTKTQVQRTLGTPLITDPFHQNRWDYAYYYKQGNKISDQRHITLFFSGETLDRFDDGTTD